MFNKRIRLYQIRTNLEYLENLITIRIPNRYNPFLCQHITIFILISVAQLGFPGGSAGKQSTCNVEDLGSTPGLGRSPGEGNGYPLQYSGLEIPWTIQSMGSQRVYIHIN